jgi:hypothetical protein
MEIRPRRLLIGGWMKWRFYFILIVFYFAAVLMAAVYLRSADNRIFYRLNIYQSEQNRMKQQLWQKQLQLESLLNPASISKQLEH